MWAMAAFTPRPVANRAQRILARLFEQAPAVMGQDFSAMIDRALAGLEAGATVFDAALGGLGGCPFIPGATGNIATEDAVFALEEMGVATGIDWRRLAAMVPAIEEAVGRPLPGRMAHLAGGACASPSKN